MLGLTATTVAQVVLMASSGAAYQQAFDRADKEDKPLLVLVGAEWCPGCRQMKNQTIPELKELGSLKEVVFTEVDTDSKPELTRKILRGTSIPQLVLYTPVGKNWRRTHLTGAQSANQVQQFLKREIATGRDVAEKTENASVATPNVTHVLIVQ